MVEKLSRNYHSGIDGLRAIAVLAVILFHMDAFPFWQGGFTGVDIFFVISGFVISQSLAGRSDRNMGRFLLDFYRRRLVRIMPALAVMLLVTTLAAVLFIPVSWLSRSIDGTGLAAFFAWSNVRIALDNGSYFSPVAGLNPFLHTWSLGVEEQFYLIFPLIAYFQSHKRVALNRAANIFLALLAGVSFYLSILGSVEQGKTAYYFLSGRFWELAAGALLYRLCSRDTLVSNYRLWSNLLMSAGLGMMGAGFFMAGQDAFPYPWALLPVLGTVFSIIGTIESEGTPSILQKILTWPVLTYIGRISYSLYLWHWPVAVLFRWTFGFTSLFAKCLFVLVTGIFALVSYHFIETPIRRSAFLKKQKNWKIVVGSLTLIIVAAGLAWLMWDSRTELSLSVTRNVYIWQSGRYEENGSQKTMPDDPDIRGRRLFVVGDSHAAAYRTMLTIVSKDLGVEVREFEEGDCPVAGLLSPMDSRTKTHYQKALREIKALARPGDVVFLASLRMPTYADNFEPTDIDTITKEFFSEAAVRNRHKALEEAHAIVASFRSTGALVVMEAPLPVLFAPPYRCSDWFNKMNPIAANGLVVSRTFLERIRQPVLESISRLADSHKGFLVWDPFPILCPEETFSAYDGQGEPIFWDGDHLSGNGNRMLAPSFENFLRSLWTQRSD